jgi:hypothetical protein
LRRSGGAGRRGGSRQRTRWGGRMFVSDRTRRRGYRSARNWTVETSLPPGRQGGGVARYSGLLVVQAARLVGQSPNYRVVWKALPASSRASGRGRCRDDPVSGIVVVGGQRAVAGRGEP